MVSAGSDKCYEALAKLDRLTATGARKHSSETHPDPECALCKDGSRLWWAFVRAVKKARGIPWKW